MRNMDLKNKAHAYDLQRKAELSKRFKKVVDQYGVTTVADLLGLKESTVQVYARSGAKAAVTEYDVVKAETLLNEK